MSKVVCRKPIRRPLELLGYSREEFIDRNIKTIIHPDWVERFEEYVHQLKATDETPNREFEIIKSDGTGVHVYCSGRVQYDDHGRFHRMHCIFLDITRRKEAEDEIKMVNRQLQTINAEKDKLFSIISHDLKAPMATLLVSTGMLADQPEIFSEQDIRLIAKELHINTRNTFALLEDLLQWSRMSQGGIDYNPGPCSLHELINTSFYTAQDMAKSKDVAIRLDIPQGLTVCVDQPMINTVVRNLLFNAVKFTRRGGEIVVTASRTGQDVTMSIQDNGIGMAPNVLADSFSLEKVNRQAGTEGEKGTGLGLVLCKQFIERHEGRIWLESTPGQGATVFFTLPAMT